VVVAVAMVARSRNECVWRQMHNDAVKVKQRGQINGIAMSSFGYKRKSEPCCRHVRLSPNRRHSISDVCLSPDFFRSTPNFGRGRHPRRMSHVDPQETF
jgi:hypothetical protein